MALAFTPSPVFVYPFSERASMNSLGATITIGDWFVQETKTVVSSRVGMNAFIQVSSAIPTNGNSSGDLRTVPKNGREVLFYLAGKNKKTPVFGA
jgi:hypothetical protein